MDFAIFSKFLVPLCEGNNVFDMERVSNIPIKFKILVALKILGHDNDCDTMSELPLIGESTRSVLLKAEAVEKVDATDHGRNAREVVTLSVKLD